MSIATDYFKFIVFRNPAWDFTTLDFDRDVARADAPDRRAQAEPHVARAGEAAAAIARARAAGIRVVKSPADIGAAVKDVLKKK